MPGSQHAAFAYGIEKGIFKDEGIDLTILNGTGSSQAVKILSEDHARFGFAASEAVAIGVSNDGAPVRLIGTYFVITQFGLALKADLDIKKPGDIKGKRIASPKMGASRQLLPMYLEAIGLKMTDIIDVLVGVRDEEKAVLFNAGKADVAGGNIGNYPGLQSFTKSKLGWFAYSDFLPIPGDGIVVNTKYLKSAEDRGLNCRMIRAVTRSFKGAVSEPDFAVAAIPRVFKQPLAGNDVSLYKKGWVRQIPLVIARQPLGKPIGFTYKEDWERSLKLVEKHKLINEIKPIDQYFSEDYVKCAAEAP